ncbi:MAG: hypothetical protein ACRDM1_12205 [Gaiellaceae bacterium]
MRTILLCGGAFVAFLVGGAGVAVLAVALSPVAAFVYHVLSEPPEGPFLTGSVVPTVVSAGNAKYL